MVTDALDELAVAVAWADACEPLVRDRVLDLAAVLRRL